MARSPKRRSMANPHGAGVARLLPLPLSRTTMFTAFLTFFFLVTTIVGCLLIASL